MRILIATGGSAHSEVALQMTGTLAAAAGAQVTLLSVAVSEGQRAQAETVALQAAATLREWVGDVETASWWAVLRTSSYAKRRWAPTTCW